MPPKTLYEKIWDSHVVREEPGKPAVIYIDRHLIHEGTSPQAFAGLRSEGRKVRRPDLTFAVMDHSVPTTDRTLPIIDTDARLQFEALEKNCRESGVRLFDMNSRHQGIVHIIGPELGITQPGQTIVCGDSHTSTHGAFGTLAFGIGTSEVEHVLATQCLVQGRSRTLHILVHGKRPRGVTAKDLILAIIGKIGISGGTGHVAEYGGEAIRSLTMDGRMTVCNMTIEGGARAGMVAPDETTFAYLEGRPFVPRGKAFQEAVERWQQLHSDENAKFDMTVELQAAQIAPQVTWGTNPGMVTSVTGRVPGPGEFKDLNDQKATESALKYMGLKAGTPIVDIPVDRVFIGSCTNSRLDDLRAAAHLVAGKHVAKNIKQALIVPGSRGIKAQAEKEGLDKIFREAGFEWRDAGCSMCIGMNADVLPPHERSASTSNRNFEGRQGKDSRTHLVSPVMAAAFSVSGARSAMQPFSAHTGMVAPLDRVNVDTDQMVPKQFLKALTRQGFGRILFYDWRYLPGEKPNPQFVLNFPRYDGASILLARANFGCGSSREHAPWGVKDYGFRVIIAPSYADIFYNNCFKNGILPAALSEEQIEELFQRTEKEEGYSLTVNLPNQTIADRHGLMFRFDIAPARKEVLLKGLDDIGTTLQHEADITAYEKIHAATATMYEAVDVKNYSNGR